MKSSFELLAAGRPRAPQACEGSTGQPGGEDAPAATRWHPPCWSARAPADGYPPGWSRPGQAADRGGAGAGWPEVEMGEASPGTAAGKTAALEAQRGSRGAGPVGGPLDSGTLSPAAQARARCWLARARRMARQWLERARAEAEEVRQRAWQAGYAEGQAAAQEQLAAQLERLERQWQERCRHLAERYRQLLQHSREDVLELALSVARQVAGQELAAEPQRLRTRIEEGLSKLGADGARVLVHPDRVASIRNGPLPPGVRVDGDGSLRPEDFRIESPRGEIDGRVDAQVRRLGEVLRAAQGQGAAVAGPAPGRPGAPVEVEP